MKYILIINIPEKSQLTVNYSQDEIYSENGNVKCIVQKQTFIPENSPFLQKIFVRNFLYRVTLENCNDTERKQFNKIKNDILVNLHAVYPIISLCMKEGTDKFGIEIKAIQYENEYV